MIQNITIRRTSITRNYWSGPRYFISNCWWSMIFLNFSFILKSIKYFTIRFKIQFTIWRYGPDSFQNMKRDHRERRFLWICGLPLNLWLRQLCISLRELKIINMPIFTLYYGHLVLNTWCYMSCAYPGMVSASEPYPYSIPLAFVSEDHAP